MDKILYKEILYLRETPSLRKNTVNTPKYHLFIDFGHRTNNLQTVHPFITTIMQVPPSQPGKNERFTKYYLITSLKRIAANCANAPRSGEPYRFSDVTENVNKLIYLGFVSTGQRYHESSSVCY